MEKPEGGCVFSYPMIDVGEPSALRLVLLLAGGPRVYMKAGWAGNGEQASKLDYSAGLSCLHVPALTALSEGLWYAIVSRNKPFSPQASFGHGIFIKATETLIKKNTNGHVSRRAQL